MTSCGGGIHPERGDVPWEVSTPRSPVPASLHLLDFAAQAKPVRFVRAGASALHTLPFSFNSDVATGTQEIEV